MDDELWGNEGCLVGNADKPVEKGTKLTCVQSSHPVEAASIFDFDFEVVELPALVFVRGFVTAGVQPVTDLGGSGWPLASPEREKQSQETPATCQSAQKEYE